MRPSAVEVHVFPQQTRPRPLSEDPAFLEPPHTCVFTYTQTRYHLEVIHCIRLHNGSNVFHYRGAILQIEGEAVQLSCSMLLTELDP